MNQHIISDEYLELLLDPEIPQDAKQIVVNEVRRTQPPPLLVRNLIPDPVVIELQQLRGWIQREMPYEEYKRNSKFLWDITVEIEQRIDKITEERSVI